jgi:integrase
MVRRAKGEGSIRYDNKHDRYIWRLKFLGEDGLKHEKYLTAKTKKGLQEKIKEYQSKKELNISDVKLADWSSNWLTVIKPTIKISTYDYYDMFLRNYINPNLGEKKVKDLTPIMLQEFFNQMVGEIGKKGRPLSATTINGMRRTLKTCLEYAVKNGVIRMNPAATTKPLKKADKKVIALSKKQVIALLSTASKADYIYTDVKQDFIEDEGKKYLRKCYYYAIALDIATGMRIGELFGLTWDDVDFDKFNIMVRRNLQHRSNGRELGTLKTIRSQRLIQIDEKTINLLKEWREYQNRYAKQYHSIFDNDINLVFTNSWGKMYNHTNFYRRYWRKLVKAAGLPEGFNFHGLRHTHATLLLLAGENIKAVSERLGHSSVSTTLNIYYNLVPNLQKHAADTFAKLDLL